MPSKVLNEKGKISLSAANKHSTSLRCGSHSVTDGWTRGSWTRERISLSSHVLPMYPRPSFLCIHVLPTYPCPSYVSLRKHWLQPLETGAGQCSRSYLPAHPFWDLPLLYFCVQIFILEIQICLLI